MSVFVRSVQQQRRWTLSSSKEYRHRISVQARQGPSTVYKSINRATYYLRQHTQPSLLREDHHHVGASASTSDFYWKAKSIEDASFFPSSAVATSVSFPRSNEENKDERRASNQLWEHWKEQLQAAPNVITLSRIASAPILSYLVVYGHPGAALAVCLYAGASDLLDGYVAKRYNMCTVLGTYLDPLADKVVIGCMSVALYYESILPGPLVGLWLAKDAALMMGTYWCVAQNTQPHLPVIDPVTAPLKVQPTVVSKLNTGLQFTTLTVGILFLFEPTEFTLLVEHSKELIGESTVSFPSCQEFWKDALFVPLCWLTGGTTIASVLSYAGYTGLTPAATVGKQGQSGQGTQKRTLAIARGMYGRRGK